MSQKFSFLEETSTGIRLTIKVVPRSSRSELLGPMGDFLKVKLQAPPVEGAANEALIELLRDIFRVPKKNIKILRGEKSRIKQVEIQGLSLAQAMPAVLRPHKS